MDWYGVFRRVLTYFRTRKRALYIESLQKKGLRLGQDVAIVDDFFFDVKHCAYITIGDHCTIAPNVTILAHDASTKRLTGYTRIGPVEIGNKCFIGAGAIILPGVTIGSGSIIGAGSVVAKDVPPGIVAAGNPAKPICTVDDFIRKIEAQRGEIPVLDEQTFRQKLADSSDKLIMDAWKIKRIGFIT